MTPFDQFCNDKRLTNVEIGEAVGVSPSAIWRVRKGDNDPRKTNIDGILAYCKKFDPTVTYERLFGPIPPTPVATEPASQPFTDGDPC